jgi:hypothetical protein
LVVVFFAIAIATQWSEFRDSAADLSALVLIGAFGLALANLFTAWLTWRVLLADANSHLPFGPSLRMYFVGQLGKYLPGTVWPLVAQASMGHDLGVPRRRTVVVGVVTIALSIAAGLAVATATLPFVAPGAARKFWWALLALPVFLVLLYPPVMHRVLNVAMRVLRREPLEQEFSFRGLGISFATQVAAWVAIGMQIAVLSIELGVSPARAIPLGIGGAALAWGAGLLAVPAPAGLGVREAALYAVVGTVLDRGSVLVVVVASRLMMTIGDVVWAGAGEVLYRRWRRRRTRQPDVKVAAERPGAPSQSKS